VELLDAYEKLRQAAINFVMCVCLSARNNSAPSGTILIEFYVCVFFPKPVKVQVPLKFDKNNGHFTRIRSYIYDISLTSS